MLRKSLLAAGIASLLLTACGGSDAPAPAASGTAPAAVAPTAPETPTVERFIAGEHRSAADKARDSARHPAETLAFFQLKPTDTVLEVTPGAGWWTDILAPFLRQDGRYIALTWDDTVADAPKYYASNNAKLREKLASHPELYDRAEISTFNAAAPSALGKAESVDLVVTFRNTHGWVNGGTAAAMYQGFYDVLKPGGRLGVEQHRAAPGSDPAETSKQGYVSEEAVIALAEAAGFQLLAKSEVNANPKDTKDYAKGVWTLPPSLAEGDTDKDKYLAIGESDRMTLLFVKPETLPGAPMDTTATDGFETGKGQPETGSSGG